MSGPQPQAPLGSPSPLPVRGRGGPGPRGRGGRGGMQSAGPGRGGPALVGSGPLSPRNTQPPTSTPHELSTSGGRGRGSPRGRARMCVVQLFLLTLARSTPLPRPVLTEGELAPAGMTGINGPGPGRGRGMMRAASQMGRGGSFITQTSDPPVFVDLATSDGGLIQQTETPPSGRSRPGSFSELDDQEGGPEAGDGDWTEISSYLSENTLASEATEETLDRDREREEYLAEDASTRKATKEEEEEEEDDQTNLNFDEPETEQYVLYSENDNQLKAATFAKLVCKLTSSTTEIDFLLTYRSFSTPSQLLNALFQRYNSTDSTPEKIRKLVWLRLFNVLGKWIELFWYDFSTDESCPARAMEFLNSVISGENKEASTVAQGTRTKLERQIQNTQRKQFVHQIEKPPPVLPPELNVPLIAFPSIEIARQLTLKHWSIWSTIKPWECLGLSWTKKDSATIAPNITQMTEHFNYISGWVVTTIVTCPDLKGRVKLCRKFLEICVCLHRMGNFNGMMEIWSGMQRQPAYRLAKTWAGVTKEPRFEKVYQTLKNITDSRKNFSTMREVIGNTNPPVIPYLGMYLSDLVFIEEGNQKRLGPDKLINYYKCRLVSASIKKIQQYQQKGYAFEEVKAMQRKLDNLVAIMDEGQLFDISSYHEPKEGRVAPSRPASLDSYIQRCAEAETRPNDSRQEPEKEVDLKLVESEYPFSPVVPDSPTNVVKENNVIVSLTLPKLIEKMTTLSHQYLCTPFIALIPLITSPHDILDLILQRYHVPDPRHEADRELWSKHLRTPVALRVISLIKTWVSQSDSFYEDEGLHQKLLSFVNSFPPEDGNFAQTIDSALKRSVPFTYSRLDFEEADPSAADLFVLCWEPLDVAKQLTLHVYESLVLKIPLSMLYRHIQQDGYMPSPPSSMENLRDAANSPENAALLSRLMDKDTGVEVKDRRKMFKTFPRSFIAGECVAWLQKNAGMPREEAVFWGRLQQHAGAIENLSGKGEFDCAELYFRFTRANNAGPSDQDKEKVNKALTFEIRNNYSELQSLSTTYLIQLQDMVYQEIVTAKAKGESTIRQSIRRWVAVAQELEKLSNFHSLCGVVGGLHKSLSPEIRPFWDKVPEQSVQWFIHQRIHFTQPLEQLRQHHLRFSPPCIPHFAIYNGLSREWDNLTSALINLSSVCTVGELIWNFQRVQRTPPTIAPKSIIYNYLNNKFNTNQ